MKKAYITPVMEISRLETADIICSSITVTNLDIDIVQELVTPPETPPVPFSSLTGQGNS